MSVIYSLIAQAETLKDEEHRSPIYELWKHDTKEYLKENHGEQIANIFDRTLHPAKVSRPGDDLKAERNKNLERAIALLESLKDRATIENNETTEQLQNAQNQVQQRLQNANITVHGNATFGDNSPLNEIKISEFMASLIDQVEQLPESDEKHRLIQDLKSASQNPTLASVAGGVIGGVVQGLVGLIK